MSQETDPTPHRSMRLLIAAAAVAVLVVSSVFIFGVDRPPELPQLALGQNDAPALPIAWMTWGDSESCLYVAEPDGTVRELRCGVEGSELAAWERGGPLVLLRYGGGASFRSTLLLVDPETGEITSTQQTNEELYFDGPDAPVWFRDGDDFVVRFEDAEIWRVQSRPSYSLYESQVSPDRQHAVAVDSARRILLFSLTDDGSPRVWVTLHGGMGRSGPQSLLWEGTSRLREPETPRVR